MDINASGLAPYEKCTVLPPYSSATNVDKFVFIELLRLNWRRW